MRRIILALVAIMLSFTTLAAVSPATAKQSVQVVTVAAFKPPNKCDTVKPAAAFNACWAKEVERQRNEAIWYAELKRQREDAAWRAQVEAYFAGLRRAEEARRSLGGYPPPRPIGGGLLMGSGRCGPAYGLPPCWRLQTESRGIINVYYGGKPYRTHSCCSASGKWAFIDPTWRRHRGYPTAASAPEWVQDEKARQLWDGGRGCYHWSTCG